MSGGRWAKAQAKKEKRPRSLKYKPPSDAPTQQELAHDAAICDRSIKKFIADPEADPAKKNAIQILLDKIDELTPTP